VATQKSIPISGVGDVEKMLTMRVTNDVLVVDIPRQEYENTLGSNGTPKWKN